jgi:membrane protease YdiL (CAAX protease family)
MAHADPDCAPNVNRYISITGLFAVTVAALALVEVALRSTGSGLSIFDTRGAGQVLLLAVPLCLIILFVSRVPGGDPLGFAALYVRGRRRAAAGFLWFWAVPTLIIVAAYLLVGQFGHVTVSQDALAAFNARIAINTAVSLLVVLVLATTEELIFRSFIMRHLIFDGSRAAFVSAVVIAALIFAVLHNLTDPLAWFTREAFPLLVGLFTLAVLLSVTYLSTGSITCAIGVHAAFLGSKVFLRRTDFVDVNHPALLLQNSGDLRESPFVWLLWLVMAGVIYLMRKRLRARFAIETDFHMLKPSAYRRERAG